MTNRTKLAKEPANALIAGPYGHPFHPILVTVPIGAWVCSLVLDIASWFVAQPAPLAQASQWLIGIGVVGAVAAAVIGMVDASTIPGKTPAYRVALVHMALNLAAIAVYIGNFVWRHADSQTTAVPVRFVLLSLVAFAAVSAAGYLGGKLAYHYGVRVAREEDQADGFRGASRPESADQN
ncbi:DUF2231 domain-containing protein [Mycolicibacterium sp. BiH015]|uniref:DUF2231 domain-containing protein n=1 Tax=Mycolicibacterium sp. BiH015 TaxID=3018808 RepID=UPI0022E62F7C|nr:DUF2231 domain-containing protein [Mycolicibacterium sp. BiH015]MDA2893274.1 DUF2231 domain-containing protein [Mycolicibacterium sp. BiH015]